MEGCTLNDRFRNDTSLKWYRRLLLMRETLIEFGIPDTITLRESIALNKMTIAFFEHEHITQKQLVEYTGLSKVAVSRYVSNWLKLGWLNECLDPDDRRLRLLCLSELALKNSESLINRLEEIE